MTKNEKRISFLVIVTIIALVIACNGERKRIEDRCDYDGAKIGPLYAVYFSLQDGSEKKYCSIICASMSFSELKKKVKEVMVVDEVSEKKIRASKAFFVESEVITTLHVKNRIHVFANIEDAERHLKRFNGKWIENPFPLSLE